MQVEYLVGFVLGLATLALGTLAGFERDRSFYPVLVIVVASYYVAFAAMSGQTSAILAESTIALGFTAAALVGHRTTMWLIAAALAGHGVMDLALHHLVNNPGVPVWWPAFCGVFDLVAAAGPAWQCYSRQEPPAPAARR